MNNRQFRNLVLDTPARENGEDSPLQGAPAGEAPTSFGGQKSSMTPRNVKSGIDVDFARQVRERNAALQPRRKFKSSAPKGVKYGAGYTDRAKAREQEGEGEDGDSKAARIKALEEQMKLGQISMEAFEALRGEITGGDITNTHLIKGLDRKLLERVRRGENVLGTATGEKPPDVDEELNKLGEKDVETVRREKAEKKGALASQSVLSGKKRSRDEIMAELKAQRRAASQVKAGIDLGERWRKVGEKERSRIEIDHKGREVLITVDEDGVVKKKVRKVAAHPAETERTENPTLDESKPILGADVDIPADSLRRPASPDEDEDDDIFEGVGAEYNPLGNDDDDDDDESDDSDRNGTVTQAGELEESKARREMRQEDLSDSEPGKMQASAPAQGQPAPVVKRNYFEDTPQAPEEATGDRFAGIQSVLQKAAKLEATTGDEDEEDMGRDDNRRRKKRAQMLAQQDRDLEDMDMGFGSSRFEDGEDEEGEDRVRLSEWKGTAGGDDGWEADGRSGAAGKKKRKPKKRKGDVNNASDIMRVIEGRKAGGK